MGQPAFNYRDLPIDQRLQLVEDIWDSIAEEANARPGSLPLSDAQRAELDRRLADADAPIPRLASLGRRLATSCSGAADDAAFSLSAGCGR